MRICRSHSPPLRACFCSWSILGLTGLITVGLLLAGCRSEPAADDTADQTLPTPVVTEPALSFPPVPGEVEDLYAHSVAVAERTVAECAQSAQTLFDLASTHQRFGFDHEAVVAYRRGLQLDARRPDIYSEIGFLLSQKAESEEDAAGDFQEALEAYCVALRLNPHGVGTRTRIGMIHTHQGQLDQAIEEYQQEIQQQTASADTFYHLGQALLLKEDSVAAEQAFRACLQRDSQHRNGLYGLFQSLRNQGREAESREFLESWQTLRAEESAKVESLPPRNSRDQEQRFTAETYFRSALTYLDARRFDEALQHLEAALLFDPTNYLVATSWVDVLRQLGRADDATKLGLRLMETQPENVALLYAVAGLLIAQQDIPRSAALLEQVLKIQPQHADANRELARLIMRKQLRGADSGQESLKYAQLAVQQQRSAPNLDVLAIALFMSGRRPEAVETLEEAVRLAPDNQEFRQRLKDPTTLMHVKPCETSMLKSLRNGSETASVSLLWCGTSSVKSDEVILPSSAGCMNSRGDRRNPRSPDGVLVDVARCGIAVVVLAAVLCSGCRQELPLKAEALEANREKTVQLSAPQYRDQAQELGVQHVHTDGSSGRYFIAENLASGVGLWDYDGDGRLDLYFPNGRMLPPGAPPAGNVARAHAGNVLYRQREDGTFVDVTQTAGVAGTAFGVGCCVGDYDADGDLDLYVTQYGPNILYRNNGDGTFVDVAAEAGVGDPGLGVSAAFFDYDSDGDLDLYVSNYVVMDLEHDKPRLYNNVPRYQMPEFYSAEPDRLFRNDGNGRFTDVSDETGIHASPAGRGMGVIATDVNGDGRLDLFVANDASENHLFINRGDGTFQEDALMVGVALDVNGDEQGCMGVDIADCDADGRPDLMVTNYQRQANALYRMGPTGFFTDEALSTGVAEDSLPWVGWGTGFFDYDNDGFFDVFIANGHLEDTVERFDQSSTYKQPNQLLRNTGSGKFQDVSREAGPGLRIVSSSRGAAFGDLDNDGDIDIVVCNSREKPNILINDSPRPNHWLGLKLCGKRDRFAINAQATVYANGKVLCREIRSGSSYASQNDLRLHFGLGSAKQVEKVEIRWPDGQTQLLTDVPIDCYTTVEQAN